MNRADVLKLLTFAASIDKRTVGDADIKAWHLLLEPLDYERAMNAVISHFRHRPSVYLEPGHIWQTAKTTTEGESREAVQRFALASDCDHGSFCPRCKGVHPAGESCTLQVRAPVGIGSVVDLFRPPALAIGTAEQVDPPADLPPAEAAAQEAERHRQLAALEALADEVTA